MINNTTKRLRELARELGTTNGWSQTEIDEWAQLATPDATTDLVCNLLHENDRITAALTEARAQRDIARTRFICEYALRYDERDEHGWAEYWYGTADADRLFPEGAAHPEEAP